MFPLIFFFIFATLFHAEQGGAIVQVLTMVLSIGILGIGFFGAGIRAVQDREANILRRFKVAPISAAPMLVASLLTGVLNFLPSALLMILLSHYIYGMPFPATLDLAFPVHRLGSGGISRAGGDDRIGGELGAGKPDRNSNAVFSHAVPERHDDSHQRVPELAAIGGAVYSVDVPGEWNASHRWQQ